MIEKGARNLVLVSRHATSHPGVGDLRKAAEASGCLLAVHDCDISDEVGLQKLLNTCSQTLPPIRGVINGAMVLDDTVLERMTHEQWTRGVRPKIDGSRNLHNYLSDLSFFILLSSVAGVAGHMSQANYVAGNSFQDSLARHRTLRGQPAVAIDLGAVRSVGYVAEREASGDERLRARVENIGFGSVDFESIMRLVEAGIRDPLRRSPSDSQIIVGPNFHAFASESAMRYDRRFGTLRIASQRGLKASSTSASKSSTAELSQALLNSTTADEATEILIQALSTKISDIFNIPFSDIDIELPLSRYGVDSLVAVELRNWLSGGVRAKVTVFEILQSASLAEFAALVGSKSELLLLKNQT